MTDTPVPTSTPVPTPVSTSTPPRLVVFTAPSGAGKTTIARRLLANVPGLRFSVSATTRPPRIGEVDGRDYHFVSDADFRAMIERGDLVEHEEVYPGRFYGTPWAELAGRRTSDDGLRAIVLDVDVKGALAVKERFGDRALAVFVAPPSIAELERRLRARGTETETTLAVRLGRAADELSYADRFDAVVVNADLDEATTETLALVRRYLGA